MYIFVPKSDRIRIGFAHLYSCYRLCSWSNFMFYGLEQPGCFQIKMPTLRFSSTLWLGFFYTELFHEFVAFIYTIVITLYCFVFINLNICGADVYVVRIYHRNNRHIECVLLSFLSKKIVSTKWRIEKGILVGPRLLRRGISRGCRECELFFQLKSLQKIYIGT
jgi:hypothetical protein